MGKRQMVGNGGENDSCSYHRCVSIFKALHAYVSEKFKHSDSTSLFFFSFVPIPFPHLSTLPPICVFLSPLSLHNIEHLILTPIILGSWSQVYPGDPTGFSLSCKPSPHRALNKLKMWLRPNVYLNLMISVISEGFHG